MISFNLRCDNFHEFSCWFSSSADFDMQQERGLLSCPVCASETIEKSLMAPAISTSRRKEARLDPQEDAHLGAAENVSKQETGHGERAGQQVAVSSQPTVPALSPEVIEKYRQFKRQVLANSEDVGERFAEEARKIHYGESEARGVHGKASMHEAVALAEEGITVLPLPELPDEKN